MTRKYYSPDPEADENGQTGYTIVSYRRPRTEREIQTRRRNAEKRALELEEIMADPVTAYRYERDQEIKSRYLRLERDPKFAALGRSAILRYIRSYMGNDGEPMILKNPSMADDRKKKVEVRVAGGRNRGSRHDREVEQNAEEGNLKTVLFDPAFIERVKSARMNRVDADGKVMTQKELGMLINRTESVIADLEQGLLPYSGGLKALLTWKLGLN